MANIEDQIGLTDLKADEIRVRYGRYKSGRELSHFLVFFGWAGAIALMLFSIYAFSKEEGLIATVFLGVGLLLGFTSSMQGALFSAFFDVAENIERITEALIEKQ